MARAAVLGRLTWQVATVVAVTEETTDTRTITLEVEGWPGHVAGQHMDVRLTAPDGYTATRSYSIGSAAPLDGADPSPRIDLTVSRVPDGEVSGYLAGEMAVGDQVEVRGPLGGWFVWRPEQTAPVQLVAGGVGLVPLMSMVRTRAALLRAGGNGSGSTVGGSTVGGGTVGGGTVAPMHLLCSVRDPAAALYRDELTALAAGPDGVQVTWVHTRQAGPQGGRVGRVDAAVLREATLPASGMPSCYVCGPTGFVETAAGLLVDAGHDPDRIRAERFGPTGGRT